MNAPRVELEAHYYDPRCSRAVPVRVFASEASLRVSGAGVDVECAHGAARIAPPLLGATLEAVLLPNGAKFETSDKVAVERLRQLSGRPVPFGLVFRAEEREHWRALFAGVAADHPGLGLKLEFRRAGAANAFSLPDGTIVLTDEIVQLSRHDDQLRGVLYHEAGHVMYGHGLRRVIESSALALLVTTFYGDADQVTAVAGGLPLAYARSHYSREEELEADVVALDGLRRHGKDTRHFASILRALERSAGGADRELEYLSSHPSTSERVKRFEAEPAQRH